MEKLKFFWQPQNIFYNYLLISSSFHIFAIVTYHWCSYRGTIILVWTLHNGKASHDALSIGYLELPHSNVGQRQLRSLMSRVCWICIPNVCEKAIHAFTAHLLGISAIFAWMSLCSSTNVGCGKPQIADEQKVDTHVFRCVGSWIKNCIWVNIRINN